MTTTQQTITVKEAIVSGLPAGATGVSWDGTFECRTMIEDPSWGKALPDRHDDEGVVVFGPADCFWLHEDAEDVPHRTICSMV